MRVRAILRLKNAAAVEAREKLGLSQREMADAIGIKKGTISNLECMRFRSISKETLETIAAFLDVDENVLIPPELRTKGLRNRFEITKDVHHLDLLIDNRTDVPMIASAPMEDDEAKRVVNRILNTLTLREREILKLRYGIGEDGTVFTREEIGKIFRMSTSRVGQVEAKAIQKMQRPSRIKALRRITSLGDKVLGDQE